MAAPQFSPTPVVDSARSYSSPDRVPSAWMPNRPGEITGFQPQGERLGYQGPDQGFAIKIANGFTDRLQLQPGEHAADVIKGCLGIGLRRASLFSRGSTFLHMVRQSVIGEVCQWVRLQTHLTQPKVIITFLTHTLSNPSQFLLVTHGTNSPGPAHRLRNSS